jgi:hypothetical protein
VAVGAEAPVVGVAAAGAVLVGGGPGFSPVGMSSSVPMLIMVLVRLFNSMMACAVVPKRIAIALSVSPGCTT